MPRNSLPKPINSYTVYENMNLRLASSICLALLLFALTSTKSLAADQLTLLPRPTQVELGAGEMSLRDGFTVRYTDVQDERVTRAVGRLYDRISRKLGFVVMQKPVATTTPGLEIVIDKKSGDIQRVTDDESYTLTVTPTGATLHAPEPLGALRGLETFYQLVFNTNDGYGALPVVKIDDRPRFPWRGLLLDVARHYMPLKQIEREVDGLAAVKMDVLHLHLSDDQSFRVESKKFPELTEKGSHGQFYTQEQIKDLVAYARDRGVRIVPEFDVPGHSTAWLAAFPDLAVQEADPNETFTQFGGYKNTLDPSNPKLMKTLDKLFGEMASLFPDEYFHIGGDEVDYTYWRQSAAIAAFKQKHHLQDEQAVQTYFNTELEKLLSKHHKKMMGWNEILHADLPKTTVIQSWIGVSALEEAVQRGYPVVVSLSYYLDNYMPAWFHYNVDPLHPDPQTYEDLMDAIPNGHQNKALNADKVAAENFKPSPEAERLVMGGEAAEWTELTTPWSIDAEIWPRLGAIAERFWSPADVKDVDSLYRRLDALRLELSDLGISPDETLRVLRVRLAGSDAGAQVIATFAEAVEPTKLYTRHRRQKSAGMYSLTTPVNRLVDAVPPESRVAREFHKAVSGWLANRNAQDLKFIRKTLQRWENNDPPISRLVKTNPRMSEARPLVDSLRGHLSAASEAISYIELGEQAPAWWTQAQHTVLDAPRSDIADLQIAVMCDVRRLVDVASGVSNTKATAFCVSN
jgi:hexosaminidase